MSNIEIEIIAFHGWGLSGDFWAPWQKLIPPSIELRCANRGYFGKSSMEKFRQAKSHKIVMLHSFGLHWCPPDLISEADHLIIFSGFVDFHPVEDDAKRRSKLILQQMMGRFIEEPEETLLKFYENLFYPESRAWDPPVRMNHERLLEDLNRINNPRTSLESLRKIPSITLLHGEMDTIVSNKNARNLFHSLRFQCQYFEIKQAGHALPYTHARQCSKLILSKLQKLEEENV
ncbi:MAG: alpha/beta hydrolase [Balneolaceae bacterium]